MPEDDERAAREYVVSLVGEPRPLRVLVTGSRDWSDVDSIHSTLDRVRTWWPPNLGMVVVHGDCPEGGDMIANDWALRNPSAVPEPHPAHWFREGRAAGVFRNTEMVNLGADICCAFIRPCSRPRCSKKPEIHGSHGTMDCAHKAREAGIPVWKIKDGL